MEDTTEDVDTQNNQQTVVPAKVEIDEKELSDLKHKAEVSSQNFERAKKAELALDKLEIRLQEIEDSSPGIETEEGRVLKRQIDESKIQIEDLTKNLAKKDIFIEHPILKEKSAEFETYLADPENAGMSLKTAARAFLVENGLLDAKRKGLERPTGGDRTPTPDKMSSDQIKDLRENNFKKYQELLAKGII